MTSFMDDPFANSVLQKRKFTIDSIVKFETFFANYLANNVNTLLKHNATFQLVNYKPV